MASNGSSGSSSGGSSFNPLSLATGGISGIFNFLGAKKQADAIDAAAKLQAQSTADALNFTKQQYGDLQGRLAPYRDSGTTATQTMTKLLAASPYVAARAAAPAPTGAPAQMVTLRAPDGTTKQFQPGDPMIARATAAGAQPVG